MTRDKFFLNACNIVAERSKCMSRKVGAVLVRDDTIISTGYNGPPRKVPHCNVRHHYDNEIFNELKKCGIIERLHELQACPRQILGYKSGEGLQWCVAGHGERNALINAARNGISTLGTILYMNCGIPCTPCLVEIINAGVKEIVCTSDNFYDASAKFLLNNSNLKWRIYEKSLL